jgi:hypothetical protein
VQTSHRRQPGDKSFVISTSISRAVFGAAETANPHGHVVRSLFDRGTSGGTLNSRGGAEKRKGGCSR